jgi:uncharacterized protein YkwD
MAVAGFVLLPGRTSGKLGKEAKRVRVAIMNIFVRSVAGVVLALGLLPASAADEKDRPKLALSAAEQKLVDLTNQERKKKDLPPLQANALLFAVARAHSANMARKGEMKHVLDGKDVTNRLDDAGYDWGSARENIARSRNSTLAEVMKGWMDSKGHRANILDAKVKEIGIGIVKDTKGRVFYTQVFGTERKKR